MSKPLTKHNQRATRSLFKYLEYLKSEEAPCPFNIAAFESDLNSGLYFDSSIPQGFGVGSSGALVAAIYDRYCEDKISKNPKHSTDIKALKKIFSWMESYFHGKSSGIDPTICYMGLPLLIKSKDELGSVRLPEASTGTGAVFLLNSGTRARPNPW